MRPVDIELWSLQVYEAVTRGHCEDARVELKQAWPNPTAAARRIAAHANAAHGEPILWLIGVSEDEGSLTTETVDMAAWWGRVSAEFIEDVVPSMTSLGVFPPDGAPRFTALLFETDRAPYLVKNPSFGKPSGGPVAVEVPWRDGTSTRSARRSELLGILAPATRLPSVELLGATANVSRNTPHGIAVGARADLYVVPFDRHSVVFPLHWVEAALHLRNSAFRLQPTLYAPGFSDGGSPRQELQQVVLDGPAAVSLSATSRFDAFEVAETMCLKLRLRPAGSSHPIVVEAELTLESETDSASVWSSR